MSNRILVNEGWEERVRNMLGVEKPYLSDKSIQSSDIINIAELNITSLFPSYEDFEGDKLIYLESIAILECCILLIPSMPARLPKKELGPHANHELWINWEKKKEEFIDERDSLIGRLDDLLNPEVDFENFRSFGVTFPKRGW